MIENIKDKKVAEDDILLLKHYFKIEEKNELKNKSRNINIYDKNKNFQKYEKYEEFINNEEYKLTFQEAVKISGWGKEEYFKNENEPLFNYLEYNPEKLYEIVHQMIVSSSKTPYNFIYQLFKLYDPDKEYSGNKFLKYCYYSNSVVRKYFDAVLFLKNGYFIKFKNKIPLVKFRNKKDNDRFSYFNVDSPVWNLCSSVYAIMVANEIFNKKFLFLEKKLGCTIGRYEYLKYTLSNFMISVFFYPFIESFLHYEKEKFLRACEYKFKYLIDSQYFYRMNFILYKIFGEKGLLKNSPDLDEKYLLSFFREFDPEKIPSFSGRFELCANMNNIEGYYTTNGFLYSLEPDSPDKLFHSDKMV